MRIIATVVPRRAAALLLAAVLATGAGCAMGGISTQQEAQLGAQYSAEINQQLPIVRDAAIHSYINQLGNSIAAQIPNRQFNYTFYVVNADEVNAFAVPGGYIYVNRGLIERAGNLSELAGVMAHEIGHVIERHSVEQMEKAQSANALLSVVYGVLLGRQPSGVEQAAIQVGGGAVFASYSRDAEREADQDAVPLMVRAGIDPRGLPSFFRKLLEEQQSSPGGGVAQWFSTHPTTQERITQAEQLIAQLPAGSLQGLQSDSRAFQEFRQRVSRLPAAPES